MHRSLAILTVATLVATCLQAQIQIPPPGLAVGAQYRIVFVTESARDALSTDIADYNAFVSADAAASPALASLSAQRTPSPPFAAGCRSYLGPALTLGLPFQPSQRFSIVIPNDTAYFGFPITLQGATFDRDSGDITSTNTIAACVGDC